MGKAGSGGTIKQPPTELSSFVLFVVFDQPPLVS